MLKIDKKHCKNIDIYYIGYITIKKIDDYENIYSVNPLCLIIGEVDEFTDESKEVLQKYTELWDGIKNKIETINGGKESEYGRDFMEIKFKTDDDLPSNKLLRLRMLKIIIRSVFEEDGKFNRQVYLDGCLHKL